MSAQLSEKTSPVLLAIESSGLTCGVALWKEGMLRAEMLLNLKNVHSEKLAVLIEEVFRHSGTKAQEVDGIVLSAGPGSFTGLRIGYSVAKGMAHALNLPIVEIPTLDVWAYDTGDWGYPILAMVDAHRGEVFCAIYRWEGEVLKRDSDYRVIALEQLSEFVKEKMVVAGSDAYRLQESLEPIVGKCLVFPVPARRQISLDALLQLGRLQFEQHAFSDISSCEPFYMRAFKGER